MIHRAKARLAKRDDPGGAIADAQDRAYRALGHEHLMKHSPGYAAAMRPDVKKNGWSGRIWVRECERRQARLSPRFGPHFGARACQQPSFTVSGALLGGLLALHHSVHANVE